MRLRGAQLITPQVHRDDRGFLVETFKENKNFNCAFVQDNHSYSKQGVVRGMHFQEGGDQAKLVRVGVGKIFDVIVDIRSNSPTFGEWEGVFLDDEHHQQLFIPGGFAHGFCVVSELAHVFYKLTSTFHPETERGFRCDDPDLAIKWPVETPLLSDRDKKAPYFYELRWS